MRGSGQTVRVAAVAVVVLALLGLVALAARSDRAGRVPAATPTATPGPVATAGPVKRREAEQTKERDTSGGEMPRILVVVVALALGSLALAAGMTWFVAVRPWADRAPRWGQAREVPGAAPTRDAVGSARLAAAVDAGLRELEAGGPGEGIVACWVQLERAAADAGTHRVRPDTPSELAGRLIDRHDVSPAPLLRLAALYREARYSRHVLPESARDAARTALARVAEELAASPVGSRRPVP